jgi:hypothetical protein
MRLIGAQPADIPASWQIWNAPRPIPGHIEWEGDFRHGIFYAAISPTGDFAEEMTTRCRELDARPIDYVSMEIARAELMEAYIREFSARPDIYGPDPGAQAEQVLSELSDPEIAQYWASLEACKEKAS